MPFRGARSISSPPSDTRTTPGRLELEQPRRGRDAAGAVRRERLGIEPLQVGEAPRLVRRRRQRQRPVALEQRLVLVTGCVPPVEHERVPVGIGEPGLLADAGDDRLALELDALRLELGARGRRRREPAARAPPATARTAGRCSTGRRCRASPGRSGTPCPTRPRSRSRARACRRRTRAPAGCPASGTTRSRRARSAWLGVRAVGVRRVPVVQQQAVSVGIREDRAVADAGVPDLARELDARLLELARAPPRRPAPESRSSRTEAARTRPRSAPARRARASRCRSRTRPSVSVESGFFSSPSVSA